METGWRRRRSRRAGTVLVLAMIGLDGCSEAPTGRAPTGAPIVQLDPPTPDDDSPTAPGCEGITEAGTCDGAAAIFCDVDRGSLSRSDCAAFGESCVIDTGRGATCAAVPDSIPPSGVCDGDVAYLADGGVITRWDCGAEGSVCEVDGCGSGAYCCAEGKSDAPQPEPACCDPKDLACADPCADDEPTGDDDTPQDPSPEEEVDCDAIGYEGICPDPATLLYCVGDSPVSQGCQGGDTCQVDTCSPGLADCCPPDAEDTVPQDGGGDYTCDEVGHAVGICDGNTLYYCLDDELFEQPCGAQACEIDTCFEGGADCC